ncbi:MAG TPA: hypothetical protein VKT77_06905 [Chthonomonadaceae bacterium]|nr:hypothetical protein [Chthonomonadaceae bacterium]
MDHVVQMVLHMREAPERNELFEAIDQAIEVHLQEIGEIKMTGARELLERGRKEGREEGRKEGRDEGRKEGRDEGRDEGRIHALRETVRRQIDQKFGAQSIDVANRIDRLSEAQLVRAVDRIITATSIGDII